MAKGQTVDQGRLGKEENRRKREEQQAKADVTTVMALAAGRRFMYRLIFETCGLQDVYLAQDSGIYKHEGKRGVGVALALDLQVNHTEAYIQMISERMKDLKYNSQVREEPKADGDDT